MPVQSNLKPNREPNETGLLMCLKCKEWKPPEEFKSKQTQVTTYTDYCEGCRNRARQSMRLHHARRRQGIRVSRGRHSTDGIMYPIQLLYTIPKELLPVYEKFHAEQLQAFLAKHKDHPAYASASKEYGISSTALPPRTAQLKAEPQHASAGAQLNTPRPRNDDEQAFIDAAGSYMKESLKRIFLNAQEKPSFWKQFDVRYQNWVAAGRPLGYNGPNKECDQPTEPSEPEPQSQS